MIITHVFTGADGESRLEEVAISLREATPGFLTSEFMGATGVQFVVTETSFDLHNAPCRQLVVFLDGDVEIETSLGTKKVFNAGDVLWAEDVTGRGHRIRSLVGQPRRALFIPIQGNFARE